MKFSELTKDEYVQFVQSYDSHFAQSIELYDYLKSTKQNVYLVGVKEGEKILAACLLTATRALKIYHYFYSQRGPVMDIKNEQLVRFFYSELTKFMKHHKGLYARIDPYVIINYRTHEGELLESVDVSKYIEILEELGYNHQGYTVGFDKIAQPRWLSNLVIKDKTEDDLLKAMEYKTRRNINKTIEMGVQLRDLGPDEMDVFYELFKMAVMKHDFAFRTIDFYERIRETYKDKCRVVLSYIDLNDYLKILQTDIDDAVAKREDLKQQLELNPTHRKLSNKVKASESDVERLQKKYDEIKELKETDGDILNLASAIYIFNNNEVYYLASGSDQRYNQFMGPYNMMWRMIQFAKSMNAEKYNFYGISGDFTENAEDYGVIKFKKGFNAVVEEYIGDFIKVLRPMQYKVFNRK